MKSLTFVLGTFLILCLSLVNVQAQTAPSSKACQKICSKVCDKSSASAAVVNPQADEAKKETSVVKNEAAKAVLVSQATAADVQPQKTASPKANCNPADCKPADCNPANCNPANCDPAKCKKG